jgi:predicted PurR-regulated permease PerM
MMAQRPALFWLTLLAGFAALLWLLSPILLPFVLGTAFAYFVDPLVERLERTGLSRIAASAGIVLVFTGVGVTALLVLTPVLIEQITALVARVPDLVVWVHEAIVPLANRVIERVGAPVTLLQSPSTTEIFQQAAGLASTLVRRLLSDGFAVANVISLLALTPLVAFYLLRDWPRVVAEVDGWLPRRHADVIREQLRRVDAVLAGFARGSATLCLAQAVFYAVALTLAGLDFGLIIGLGAGAISFVPYLGALTGIVTSVGVAIYQFWPAWGRVALVAGIFVTGQILQDYVLAPRLIGEQVGLHPLWIIFAVLSGGTLFGFAGVLLAVPTCAVIGVLVRFTVTQYKQSSYYQ